MTTPLYEAILTGKAPLAKELAQKALDDGASAPDLISREMIPAMDEAGRLFEIHKFFVPHLMIAAKAMKDALAVLAPALTAGGSEPLATVVIGTVKGDMHDIGKNLVTSMLEGAGFRVVDLGVNVAPEKFVQAVLDENAQILCMSALLTTTMPSMRLTGFS